MVTTTAMIAALQTMEIIKLLKTEPKNLANSFLNLALPSLIQSEPQPAKKYFINSQLSVDLWDRWEVTLSDQIQTLFDVMKRFEEKYTLQAQDVFYGAQPIYIRKLMNKEDTEVILKDKILSIFQMNHQQQYLDITITFTLPNSEIILQNLPVIRLHLK